MSNSTKGLAGVVAADSSLSHVDGEKGRLIYHGYDIMDLGRGASYEEVVYLLWNGELPDKDKLETFRVALVAKRALPSGVLEMMHAIPNEAHPMAVLRTVASSLGLVDPKADDNSLDRARDKALRLTAAFPTIIAAWELIRTNKEPIEPRSDLDHATNFLYMLSGKVPSEEAASALNAYLVLLADHGLNASTFACRVTTATQSDVYSAITSGIGTLKGAAHGGANQRAMEQFIQAAQRGDIDAWFKEIRAENKRIMGIGHRVYKVEDPRATILRPLAKALAESSGKAKWYEIAARIEALARADDFFIDRSLHANVDFYSAIVLYMLDLPIDQFTCMFAMSRIAGWMAHVLEQLQDNRLIRPRANYIGPRDLAFIPLEQR